MKHIFCKSGLLAIAAVASVAILPLNATAADKIKMTMNWTADTAHFGFAMAHKNGYYNDAGLDVEFEEGRGSAIAAQLVATGQADLGLADAGAALNVASKGAPIKVISTIWKAGQFGIQYLESSGITEPKDLVGKKLAVPPGSAMVPLVPAFLKANGIAESDVEIISVAQNAILGLLVSGGIDAVAEVPANTVVPLAEQGHKAGNMYFYNNGVPLVSLSLIAREDKLASNPDVYEKFIEASARGWQDAINDPEASVDALLALFPDTQKSKETLQAGAKYMYASVCPGGAGDVIGATDAATWDSIYGVMTTAMEFPTSKPVTDYYSLDYLPSTPVLCP